MDSVEVVEPGLRVVVVVAWAYWPAAVARSGFTARLNAPVPVRAMLEEPPAGRPIGSRARFQMLMTPAILPLAVLASAVDTT
jgi:hypothetical protein